MPLASLAEAREFAGIDDSLSDSAVTLALAAASRRVQAHCGRTFDTTATPSTRLFDVRWSRQQFDLPAGAEIASAVGLIVATDENDDGTAETTWAATRYVLSPLDGIGPDGQSGWPVTSLTAVDGCWPASASGRPLLSITARWGWLAVPDPVRLATLFLGRELLPSITLGYGGFTGGEIPRGSPVAEMLQPFVRGMSVVGIG